MGNHRSVLVQIFLSFFVLSLIKSKTIYMDFGNPMEISGSGKEEHEKIIEFISSSLTKWEGED